MRAFRSTILAVTSLILAGCAATPAYRAAPFPARTLDHDPEIAACARLVTAADEVMDAAKVTDRGLYAVPGFPYLRTDRFTAAQAGRLAPDEWYARMRSFDRDARRIELANLPPDRRVPLEARAEVAFPGMAFAEALDACGDRLLTAARADGSAPTAVQVPDEYETWKRVTGLYAITKYPLASSVRKYQRETASTFALPLDQLPMRGPVERYVPHAGVIHVLADADRELRPELKRHAPVLEIETVTDHDRIGNPTLDDDGAPLVDIAHPVTYVRVAHTMIGDQALTQLVYSFWFPSRPKAGRIDMQGGRLDGLTWRVTLGKDGRPWVYDSIHNSGRYHQFFPTPSANAKPKPDTVDEWAFVPQTLPEVGPTQRIALRVAAGTHYLQRVSVIDSDPPGIGFGFADDADLRSIQLRDGSHRSLFGPDGIIVGTERGASWLYWPTGVKAPGAMRQWGRHATAFVGKRHFDDAYLLDRYFEFRP
ncbi:MAG: hypothetical protein K2Y35_15680 [Burkholderiales bacterium]|nr:hypothetical protein [Burkholderiales bacterium]